MKLLRKSKRGGSRQGSGRPPKPDKELWGQVTCVLRHDTIARLREGADSKFFGEFLQAHLDRYPPPTREQYLVILERGNTHRHAVYKTAREIAAEKMVRQTERERKHWAKLRPRGRMMMSLIQNLDKMDNPAFVAKLRAKRDKEEAQLAKARGISVAELVRQLYPKR